MNVNIYLPDELGERVKKADLEVSRVCQTALTREVEQAEATRAAKGKGPFRRIEVKVGGKDRPTITKAFAGRWLVDDMVSEDPNKDRVKWSVALTKGGAFAVLSDYGDGNRTVLNVYDSLADATFDDYGEPNVPEDVLAAANSALGIKTVIELDI